MDLYTLILIILLVLAVGFVAGRWTRRRSVSTATGDAATVSMPAAGPWPEQPLPDALRLEAVAPAEVVVGCPFDVYLALLPPDDPGTLPDVLRAAAEPPPLPPGARTLRVRVRIEAPGFAVLGPAEQPARWWPGEPAPVLAFRLAAEGAGDGAARLVVEQGLTEAGRARLALRAVVAPPGETIPADPVATTAATAVAAATGQVTFAVRPPEEADHLLAHAMAETYTAAELAALAEALGAPASPPGASPFTTALDLVQHAVRRGRAEALAARVAAERPDWRRAIRGNRRAERLI